MSLIYKLLRRTCLSERFAHEAIWMFFSQVGRRHSILKEELVNGYKNFNRIVCKIVFHFLLNFTHITQISVYPQSQCCEL